MFQKLSGPKVSAYLQMGVNVLAILFALAWVAFIVFLFVQDALEFGVLFSILTVLILILAYANERPQ